MTQKLLDILWNHVKFQMDKDFLCPFSFSTYHLYVPLSVKICSILPIFAYFC